MSQSLPVNVSVSIPHVANHCDILVVGSYVQDFCWRTVEFPAPGQTRIGQFAMSAGGKGFNQAVACARLLHEPPAPAPTQNAAERVGFIGSLGPDPLADAARSLAAKEGLRSHFFEQKEPTAAASVVLDQTGANLICVALGANLALTDAQVRSQTSLFNGVRVLLTQLEISLIGNLTALELARSAGSLTICNPAPIQNSDVDLESLRAVLGSADILTPNESEFADLLERLHGIQIKADDWQNLERIAALARSLSKGVVIITMGGSGVFVLRALTDSHSERYFHLPAEVVTVHDTVGAGDAFNGGLAAALVLFAKADLRAQVRYANRVAALSVEKSGAAASMPRASEVFDRFGGL